MLYDLVSSFMGWLPENLQFLMAYGCIFVLYIFVKLFKIFIDIIRDFVRGYNLLDIISF